MRLFGWIFLLCSWGWGTSLGQENDEGSGSTNFQKLRLNIVVNSPFSTAGELTRRLNLAETVRPTNGSVEEFQLIIPRGYTNDGSWGLYVWISPGPDPRFPREWLEVLAKHKFLFAGAYRAGNDRPVYERSRVVLDVIINVGRHSKFNPSRIYLSGFSGGGRVASMLGVAYSEIFAATLPICGVNFYQEVPAPGGGYFPAAFRPLPGSVATSKKKQFVLVTGEKDFNRINTLAIFQHGFRAAGYSQVHYVDLPGMSHTLPDKTSFDRILQLAGSGNHPPTTPGQPK
jgi:predicted esterase